MRSTLIGIGFNALLAAIKGIAGFLGNSYALIADAIESTSDILSSLIVWGGLKIATKPPDADHPYGHGKAEPLASAIVAMALVGAAIIIVFQSIHEIITPHHAPASFTLIVLVVVVAVKESLFRFVFKIGKAVNSIAVKTDAWHHRSDAITSSAAFVGISVALIGGAGYESADDWAALLASIVIAYNAYKLFVPAVLELMDTSPSGGLEMNVRKSAVAVEGVKYVEKCYIRKNGFEYYVDLHLTVDGDMTVRAAHQIAHDVKNAIRSANPMVADVLVHVEPPL